MFTARVGKKGEEPGTSTDYHQMMVELMPVALGVVIVLILGLLVFLVLQHAHIMRLIAELTARR